MTPLASILIPAYHERYFGEAFASVLAQTQRDIEVVVSDDSPGEAIGREVAARADPRVRYLRNAPALGFGANFSQCFAAARGRYVKFLNDDDRLHPRHVEVLAGVLEANADVVLAATRRQVIDEHGHPGADVTATMPLSHVSAFMPGIELGDFCLVNGVNFVGEPSVGLFRREQLAAEDGQVFRWGGRDFHCLADLSLWLRLLPRGLAHYGAAPLCDYRRHPGQEQRRPEVRLGCLREHGWILPLARDAGYLRTPGLRAAAVRTREAMAASFDAHAAHAAVAEAVRDLRSALATFSAGG